VSDISVSFESVEPPGSFASADDALQCIVCGAPLEYSGRGKRPQYCADHKTPASRNQTSEGSTPRKRRSGGGGAKGRKATESEWNRFLSIVLIGGTYLVGRYAAGGHGLMLDPPLGVTTEELDAYAIELAMLPEEAGPIANLMAKRVTPSELNKKVGRYIVSSLEYQEVGAALMDYGKRIGPVLVQRISNKEAPVRTPRHARKQAQTYNEGNTQNGAPTGPSTPDNRAIVAAAIERNRRAGIYNTEPPIR